MAKRKTVTAVENDEPVNTVSAPPVSDEQVGNVSEPTNVVSNADVKKVVEGDRRPLTEEAFQVWLKEFQYTDERRMQWANVLLSHCTALAQWVGHPLLVGELRLVARNDGPPVESAIPNADGSRTTFQPVDVVQIDVEGQESWPEHGDGPLTEEDLNVVCERWHDRHPLAGRPGRLGNFFLLNRKAVPFKGYLWFKLQDRYNRNVFRWVPNKPSKDGDALGKMRSALCAQREKEIMPLPRADVEAMNEAFRQSAEAKREQGQKTEQRREFMDEKIADLLGDLVAPPRGEKNRHGGGGGGYRHDRRDHDRRGGRDRY